MGTNSRRRFFAGSGHPAPRPKSARIPPVSYPPDVAGQNGDLNGTGELTIRGAGADSTIIDGGGLYGVFLLFPKDEAYWEWRQWEDGQISGPEPKLSGLIGKSFEHRIN